MDVRRVVQPENAKRSIPADPTFGNELPLNSIGFILSS